ncbi:hypothetical protein H312_00009 [Anncaliia algerae PRA339]|uniref:Uncharacterized protein n=1 Tax=Anncaliia algerae PRA339 TaxID=1288291 RepID=A0A059F5U7_9MICR|nr:hypothetical protein H312_00009 [Anncaliia algerae PRA339]
MQNNSELKHPDMCINYPFNLKNLPPSTNMLGSYNLGYLEGQKPFMRLMQQDSIQETCGQNMKMFLESKNIQEQNVNLENFGDSKSNSINLYVIDSCAKTDTHGNLNIKRRFETEENFGRKTHKKYKRNDMKKNSFVSNQPEEQTISEINETINPNIFTAKYNFLKQPHHNKIYFCPYKTFSVRDSRKFKKDYNNFDEYINHVAEDISIDLIHLINSFNEKNKIRFYKSQNSFINTLCATREFHDFLKIYFQDSMSPPTSFDILEFYDRYFIYKIWIFDNFKLMKIEGGSKYRENYIKYIDYFKKNSITNEKSLLEFYIEIFDSENYNFLFKIIPYFSLIHRIKDITGKYFVVSSIKLIQLIICRIEAFRFDYFNRNMIEDKDINELYLDQRFNETILIICILFRKLMAFCNVSEDLKLVFEVYNFIYFLRSQYYQYFTSSKIFKSIAYDNPFENKILGYKMDNLGNLIDLDFTKKIKDLDIYKIIRSKINDDLSKSIPLDVAIKPFKRRIRKKLK